MLLLSFIKGPYSTNISNLKPFHKCAFQLTFQRKLVGKPHINFKLFKEYRDDMEANIKNRNLDSSISIDKALEAHQLYGQAQFQVNELRKERTKTSLLISKTQPKERAELLIKAKALKEELASKEARLELLEVQSLKLGAQIPNFTHPDAPTGDEDNARIVEIINKKDYPDSLTDATKLSLDLDLVDFERAAKVSGSRFYYLKGIGAQLELALTHLAMNRAIKHEFVPILTPDIVKEEVMQACGFQPRGESLNQTFYLSGEDQHPPLCLAATSEITLAGMHMNSIINLSELPIRMAGQSHCFRAEAGSRGATDKGLYRVHQFTKVELFALTHPDQSDEMLGQILQFQKDFFTELGLHFRVLDMPTQELGASAYRKYDIEAWLPAQKRWGEISSTSNCTDYQSRRLNIRLPKDHNGNIRFAHTVNGTGCAVPRMIVAILEQNQTIDGKIRIPKLLQPFFNNKEFFNW